MDVELSDNTLFLTGYYFDYLAKENSHVSSQQTATILCPKENLLAFMKKGDHSHQSLLLCPSDINISSSLFSIDKMSLLSSSPIISDN